MLLGGINPPFENMSIKAQIREFMSMREFKLILPLLLL